VEESDRGVLEGYFPAFFASSEKPTTCISMISGCERTHYEHLEIKCLSPRRINEGIKYGTRKFVVYAVDVMCCT
jgi:hypothetical protein